MKLSKPLLWLLTVIWFVVGIWWYATSSCNACMVNSPPISNNIALPGFSVADGNWNLASNANLRFGQSSHIPVMSVNIKSIIDSLAMYAKNNPSKAITITGYYKTDEKNTTSFENLGLARAEEVKKYLLSKGIDEKNILTRSQAEEALVFSPADTLVGGITFAFNNAAAIPEVTKSTEVKDDLFEPRTVYFNTGKNTLPVDASFSEYIEKAKIYLQNHSDKKLIITGYTDNVGIADLNLNLSKKRAAFVKSELANKGIPNEQMESIGKGMADPIADNSTDEGKEKNRRVTIQLK
jgi:OmpA-OmpF porin, OOP family